LFSPSWYRVANLKPRLRKHAELHRHEYRGEVWFVLQDHAGGRSHRFSPAAYTFIGLMDGRRTVEELWDSLNEKDGDAATAANCCGAIVVSSD
jgi:putative peptide zinc metalloprotease protein